ncbi:MULTISPECIES: hypothetical protein [Mycobacteroides]|uniref:Proteinase inhibitor I42 chagasin domain-containing protein n=1 Tax=Mycobacteroides franklinii TaxID=948102 RepID=A0A4R5PE04_9MYCO|nr:MULTISPECIES: hypothetical protein [Mycobacteroides]ORA63891.1 hypothetical protein BST24_01480 [Mycobacteroides franklinii]TDH23657.1 hypothetical protein EJ571_05140 [Mycobacteroides franklinii]SLB99566.1 Uncharacterised protein [Mycobacteroides abscessus subsp. abscessus]SLG10175.1 Uncharacterised protein [Mycobacteroides abscessus subsp. abscessus]
MRGWGLAVLLVGAVGCSSPVEQVSPSRTPVSSPGADVVATDFDNGGRVQLRVGQVFDIVLADDYETTNCQWHDKNGYDWAVLQPLGSLYDPHKKPPDGSQNATYTSRFTAKGPGAVHVTLSEEDNAYPPRVARSFSIDVDVTTESVNS